MTMTRIHEMSDKTTKGRLRFVGFTEAEIDSWSQEQYFEALLEMARLYKPMHDTIGNEVTR